MIEQIMKIYFYHVFSKIGQIRTKNIFKIISYFASAPYIYMWYPLLDCVG